MEYLLLLLGFGLLILSGRLLITFSVSLARRLKLSPFVIGLTIVAVGTSAPELLVSLTGALKGYTDVALYNVIGSNISNILLVLAIAAIILPIPLRSRTIRFDGSIMLLFSILIWLFILDRNLSASEGIVLLVLLIIYVVASVYLSRRGAGLSTASAGLSGTPESLVPEPPACLPVDKGQGPEPVHAWMKIWMAVPGVIVASGGLALGADLLVDSAIEIARQVGLSERIISVSMIAAGTSIPELTTTAIAAFRKETDISIGNIIGSNIFNIGFVLGITSITSPIHVNPLTLNFDIFWFVGVALLLILMDLLPPRSNLARWKALSMLSVYLIYLYLILN
jgi:cation:H+ antiporter